MHLPILLLAVTLFAIRGYSQDTIVLKSQDGMVVRYLAQCTEKSEKRDKFRVFVTAVNGTPFDLYYPIAKKPQPNGTLGLGKSDPRHFSEILLTNPGSLKDFMGGTLRLSGQQTTEVTARDEILFRIPRGDRISGEMTVTVRAGQKPNLSCNFTSTLKLKDALLGQPVGPAVTAVKGVTWTSSCAGPDMVLSQRIGAGGTPELVIAIGGRLIVWRQTLPGVFEKPGETNSRITHDRAADIYTYTHIDGAVCLWRRR